MTATTSKLGEDMNDSEMNTLVIQTATAAGLRVNVDGKMLNDNYTNVMGSFPSLVRFARALLARQPAAIGKEAVFGWVQDNPGAPDKPHFILNPSGPGMTHDRVALYAAPLANEANKPAPSVEQDESPRAATVNLYICENCDAVWKRNYLHLPEGCSADDWMAVPKKRGSQSLSTLIQVASLACIENRLLDDEDRRELAEYADVIRNSPQIEARAASTSANVAQGAEPSAYRTLLDSLGIRGFRAPFATEPRVATIHTPNVLGLH